MDALLATIKEITKEEFCERTRTSPLCWIFGPDNGAASCKFYECNNGHTMLELYDKNDRLISVHDFKDMPDCKEIWMAQKKADSIYWSLFDTWTCYG